MELIIVDSRGHQQEKIMAGNVYQIFDCCKIEARQVINDGMSDVNIPRGGGRLKDLLESRWYACSQRLLLFIIWGDKTGTKGNKC